MNFKLTGKKALVSIGVLIVWYCLLFLPQFFCYCSPCMPAYDSNCEEVFTLNIIPDSCNCHCGCPKRTNLGEVISDLIFLLSPSISVYLIWSLLEGKK
jgi:hypothetical protein